MITVATGKRAIILTTHIPIGEKMAFGRQNRNLNVGEIIQFVFSFPKLYTVYMLIIVITYFPATYRNIQTLI